MIKNKLISAILIVTVMMLGASVQHSLSPSRQSPMPGSSAGLHSVNAGSNSVLMSFGNGTNYWYYSPSGSLDDGFNLTLAAVHYFGLAINYTNSTYGVFVNSLGNEWNSNSTSTGPFWILWIWNYTSGSWEMSGVGINAIGLNGSTSIAWSYVVLNAQTYNPYTVPAGTPADPFPTSSFRGSPAGTGYNPLLSNLPQTLPSGHISWSAGTGVGGVDTQAVDSNGSVYFVADGSGGDSPVLAYNYYGMLLWKQSIGSLDYELAAPLVANGEIIIPSTNGILYILNASNGDVLHTVSNLTSSPYGLTGSPVIGPEGFFLNNCSGGIDYLSFNGSLYWSVHTAGASYYSTPSYLDFKLYSFAGVGNHSVLSVINVTSGKVEWSSTYTGTVSGAPSVVDGALVFVTAVKTAPEDYYGNVTVHLENATDGATVWNFTAGESGGAPSSTVLTKNYVIFISGGYLYELNAADGKMIWQLRVNSQYASPSPIVAGNYLAYSTNSNESQVSMRLLNGEQLWNFTAGAGNYSLSSPDFNGTSVFWGDDSGHVYAFQQLQIADFNYSQHEGNVTLTAQLNNHITGPVNYTWSVDGAVEYGQTADQHFRYNGTYDVTLTVSYSSGTTSVYSSSIQVNSSSSNQSSGTGLHSAGFSVYTLAEYAALPAVAAAVIVLLLVRHRRRKPAQ